MGKCISLAGTGQAVKDICLRVKEYQLTIPVAQQYVLDMKQVFEEKNKPVLLGGSHKED
jgi:hypothetical protein